MSERKGQASTVIGLMVLSIDGKKMFIPIQDGNNLIGRWDPDAKAFPEIDLTPFDIEAKVSRKHATLDWEGGKLFLTDIGSRNGTFLSTGKQLDPDARVELKIGDEFFAGAVRLRVVAP